MRRKISLIVAVACLSLALMSCTNSTGAQNNTAFAYGLVHKQYAGRVTLTADKTSKIIDVRFDEFLPINDIAAANPLDEAHSQAVVFSFSKNASGEVTPQYKQMAKWLKIGGQMFVLEQIAAADTATDVKISYPLYGYRNSNWTDAQKWELPVSNKVANSADTSIDPNNPVVHSVKWLNNGVQFAYANENFAKFYIEAVEKGDYYVCKDAQGNQTYDFAFNDYFSTKVTKSTWANKSINGYWTRTVSQNGLGWKLNMELMRSFLINEGDFSAYTGEEEKDDSYLFGSKPTGATLDDYHDYMGLAKSAYQRAIEIF